MNKHKYNARDKVDATNIFEEINTTNRNSTQINIFVQINKTNTHYTMRYKYI